MNYRIQAAALLWVLGMPCWASASSLGLSGRSLSQRELDSLNPLQLHLLRNEVYARRDYEFKKQYLKEYFDLNWDKVGRSSNTTSVPQITNEDRNNLELISQVEALSRKRAESVAKAVPIDYELKPSWGDVTNSWSHCFWGELLVGKQQLICAGFAPTAEFWMPIVSFNWDFIGLPADFVVNSIRYVDIDTKDKFRELVITGSAFKSHEASILGYDGKRVVVIGKLLGDGFNWFDEAGRLRLASSERSIFIQSWPHEITYRLDGQHRLVPQDIQWMRNKVTLKVPLSIQRSPADAAIVATLQPGEILELISSDDKEWCLVKSSTGVEGWFAANPDNVVRGPNLESRDVFDGLWIGE